VLNVQDGELWLCVASDHEEPDIDVTLTPIRQVTGDELEAWQSVKSRLSEATVNSSFHLLTGDAVRALASCFELIESWHDEPSRATEDRVRHVKASFRAFLSGMRAFLDQTAHELSKAHGRRSDAVQAFRFMTNEVYDNNLAYRVCYALRNASQHAGQVVNHVRFRSTEIGAGDIDVWAQIGVHGPKIARDLPEMKAAVRSELAAHSHPLALEKLIHFCMLGCERIFAQAFMCNEQELDAAVAVVARYERELQTVGGGTICFQTISATPAANTSHSIDLQWVENADAITVRRVLRQSREMLKTSVQMVDQETLAFDT
jgi:hypothetical protein